MSRIRYPPTEREVWKAATAAVKALAENGYNTCLFGSAACSVYGMKNRYPNDVDLIVLTDEITQEEVKHILVKTDPDFYLVPARDPKATFEVLWYRLPERVPGYEHGCKVDVLLPGIMSLPFIPLSEITYSPEEGVEELPLMPFMCLIMMKLKGWIDHRVDEKSHARAKVPQDEKDITELLNMAIDDPYGVHLKNETWIPAWFIEECKGWVREYVKVHPHMEGMWDRLGISLIS